MSNLNDTTDVMQKPPVNASDRQKGFSNFDNLNQDDEEILNWYNKIIQLDIKLGNIITQIDKIMSANILKPDQQKYIIDFKNKYVLLQRYISPFVKIKDNGDYVIKIKKIHDIINDPEYNISKTFFWDWISLINQITRDFDNFDI